MNTIFYYHRYINGAFNIFSRVSDKIMWKFFEKEILKYGKVQRRMPNIMVYPSNIAYGRNIE